jgi:hypothetical protein
MHHVRRLSLLALALSLPALACSEPPTMGEDSEGGDSTTISTPPASDTETPQPPQTSSTDGTTTTPPPVTSSSGDDTTTTGDSGPPIIFDFPALPDAPKFEEACGQVDFIFAIDNSGSMSSSQMALVASFPQFITSIQSTLETVESYHVGVTTSDDYFYNVAGCQQIGGLVVQTGGFDSSMMACGPYEDGNFMSENDDLETAFSCAAQVGTEGSATERPVLAMLNAVTGVYDGNDECNENFIREDALLVIVIITDETDQSPGLPVDWYDQVVEAKAGIPENIVVVSLINVPGSPCNSFDPAQSIADFTMMFGKNQFMAEICLPDYGPVFQQAVEVIDVACNNYIPPN